jgi:hypothetical protein
MASEDEILDICPNNGFKHGAYFQTMVIESVKFLPWGLQKYDLTFLNNNVNLFKCII